MLSPIKWKLGHPHGEQVEAKGFDGHFCGGGGDDLHGGQQVGKVAFVMLKTVTARVE